MTTLDEFSDEMIVQIAAQLIAQTTRISDSPALVRQIKTVTRLSSTSKRFRELIKHSPNTTSLIWKSFPFREAGTFAHLRPRHYVSPLSVSFELPAYILTAITRFFRPTIATATPFIASKLPGLEELSIFFDQETRLKSIGKIMTALAKLPLRKLTLDIHPDSVAASEYNFSKVCLPSTIAELTLIRGFSLIARGCATNWTNLTHLSIAGLANVHDFTWTLCEMPQATHLSIVLHNFPRSRDNICLAIIRSCPAVHTLTLHGDIAQFIANIATCGCHKSLKRLVLGSFIREDLDLSPLKSCPKLERVECNDTPFNHEALACVATIPKLAVASFDLFNLDHFDIDTVSEKTTTALIPTIPPLEKASLVCTTTSCPLCDRIASAFFEAPCCTTVRDFTIDLSVSLTDETRRVFGRTLGRRITALTITFMDARRHESAHQDTATIEQCMQYWTDAAQLIGTCTELQSLTIDAPYFVFAPFMGLISPAMAKVRTFRMIMIRSDGSSHIIQSSENAWFCNPGWKDTWSQLRVFELINFPPLSAGIMQDVHKHCPNLNQRTTQSRNSQ